MLSLRNAATRAGLPRLRFASNATAGRGRGEKAPDVQEHWDPALATNSEEVVRARVGRRCSLASRGAQGSVGRSAAARESPVNFTLADSDPSL